LKPETVVYFKIGNLDKAQNITRVSFYIHRNVKQTVKYCATKIKGKSSTAIDKYII